jgi:hypothetical protein
MSSHNEAETNKSSNKDVVQDENTAGANATAGNIGDQMTDEQKNYAIQFLTTEHFTLQGARAGTIADSAGRATLFLSSVSSSLVALAFVGQMSQAGEIFNAFALVLFPTLFFIGFATFQRVLQSAIEDTLYSAGINRIRHFYVELVPQTKKYFILSTHDDAKGVVGNMSAQGGWWQLFLTTAGTVMVINSILLGAFVALLVRTLLNLDLAWIIAVGVLVFLAALAWHYMYQSKQWGFAAERGTTLFPARQTSRRKNPLMAPISTPTKTSSPADKRIPE